MSRPGGLQIGRKAGQTVVLMCGEKVMEVEVLWIDFNYCKLVFRGDPNDFRIIRGELIQQLREENEE